MQVKKNQQSKMQNKKCFLIMNENLIKCFGKIIILILCLMVSHSLTAQFCKNIGLFKFAIKSKCESKNGFSMSCFNNPTKANIQCESGYYSNTNISLQTITCMENNDWSEQPIECKPECVNNPVEIGNLIQLNKIQFPTSYVEVFKNSEKGIEVFSGVLLYEKIILIKCESSKDKDLRSYKVRKPKPESLWEEYDIDYLVKVLPIKNNNEQLCLLNLNSNKYFKFDEVTKPNCIRDKIDVSGLILEKDMIRPEYKYKCYPPKFEKSEKSGIEMICWDYTLDTTYEISGAAGGVWAVNTIAVPVECSNGADLIKLRCPLGYQNKKSKTNNFLNQCEYNNWKYGTVDASDCERVCGVADKNQGHSTEILSVPWHVGIYTNNTKKLKSNFEQICGGSLIHSNAVISAGHCFYNLATGEKYPASNYRIGAGKRYRKYDLNEEFQHFAGVKTILAPENYQSNPVRNDIAVIILDHHIEYTTHIKPVCIEWRKYFRYHVQDKVIGRIAGWGSTSSDDIFSEELHTIEVSTITNALCRKKVNRNFRAELTGDRFCATNNGKATACRGDSGGGFIIRKGYQFPVRHYLLGVISSGLDYSKYCTENFTATFTNIQFFQNFIKSVLEYAM